MLCPKPGPAPVTWHTAARVSFLIWLPWGERPTQGHLSARRYRELCESRRRTKKAAFLRSTLRAYGTDAASASQRIPAPGTPPLDLLPTVRQVIVGTEPATLS